MSTQQHFRSSRKHIISPGRRPLILSLAFVVICGANVVHASILPFSDRGTWETAVGSFQTEDVNSFLVDTEFQTAPVSLLNMTISQLNGPPFNGNLSNKVDVSPFAFNFSVNGTPDVIMEVELVGANNHTQVRMDFTSPVSAWGADFRNHFGSYVQPFVNVFDTGGVLQGTISLQTDGFHGFRFDAGELAGHLIIRNDNSASIGNAFLAMDDLSFASSLAPVPEPASVAVWGLLIGCVIAGRRRKRV